MRRKRIDMWGCRRRAVAGALLSGGLAGLVGCGGPSPEPPGEAGPTTASESSTTPGGPPTSPASRHDADVVPATASGTSPAAPPTGATTSDPTPASRDTSTQGRVTRVVDGDTLDVATSAGTLRVRVIGIDTPELHGSRECLADRAKDRLADLAGGAPVRLEADSSQDDVDRYGRSLRHVVVPGAGSVAEALIREGLGREYTYDRPYAHRDAHVAAQDAARRDGAGVWGSACATPTPDPTPSSNPPPRAPTQEPTRAATGAPGDCRIKGNVSADGERIYHVPGQQHYERTQISEGKGERWFCSEDEAREAGWRAAKA